MAKFFLTNKAVADLDSIWEYTVGAWSEQQADLYYSQIISVCNQIANDSKFLDREYAEIHQSLFSRHCNKHLIFYRIIDDNNIEIVRILHERMDIVSKFK